MRDTDDHLPGLDALRGIAAITVVLFHIEQIKSWNRLPNLMDIPFYSYTGGRVGVILFFVLSGFLITRMLLEEQKGGGTIKVGRFYLKRILRIWPLYYLTLALSAWLLNYTPQTNTLWMCLLIFPNLAHATIGGWAVSPQTWSIGAEEQFYLGWPWVLKVFRNHTLPLLGGLFVLLTVLPFIVGHIVENYYFEPGRVNTVHTLFKFTKFNCMVLGGLFAVATIRWPRFVRFFESRYISKVILFLPFVLWYSGVHVPYLNDEFYGIIFGILIVHVSMNRAGGRLLNNSVLDYFGKISYGIYMFHYLAIVLGLRFVPPVFYDSVWASNVVYYLIVLSFTVAAASVSYYLYERPFLTLKKNL